MRFWSSATVSGSASIFVLAVHERGDQIVARLRATALELGRQMMLRLELDLHGLEQLGLRQRSHGERQHRAGPPVGTDGSPIGSRPSSSAMMIPGSGMAKSRLNSHVPTSISPSISSVVTSSMWSAIALMWRGRNALATSWR